MKHDFTYAFIVFRNYFYELTFPSIFLCFTLLIILCLVCTTLKFYFLVSFLYSAYKIEYNWTEINNFQIKYSGWKPFAIKLGFSCPSKPLKNYKVMSFRHKFVLKEH